MQYGSNFCSWSSKKLNTQNRVANFGAELERLPQGFYVQSQRGRARLRRVTERRKERQIRETKWTKGTSGLSQCRRGRAGPGPPRAPDGWKLNAKRTVSAGAGRWDGTGGAGRANGPKEGRGS